MREEMREVDRRGQEMCKYKEIMEPCASVLKGRFEEN